MTKKILISVILTLVALVNVQTVMAKSKHDILGLYVGISREEAGKRLKKIGKLEKEERKQQEIWALTNNPHYSHIIIAFDRDYTKVRFITAKAREDGKRVRYNDVMDIKKARKEGAANNYKYVLEVPARGKELGYRVVARGADKDYLTYFSIEELEKVDSK